MNRRWSRMLPSPRYLDEAMRTRCFPDLLIWGLFPNSKEVTESFAAFSAVRDNCPWSAKDDSIICVVVGDGTLPRTGAVFACRTAWTVFSVDPKLKESGWHSKIKRLYQVNARIEDVPISGKNMILVAVHSHASLTKSVISMQCENLMVVSIPCCIPDDLPYPPTSSMEDYGILSPKRLVHIWKPNTAKKGLASIEKKALITT